MLSFKSAVVYCPGPGDEKFCDNFYFNSKVITPAMSENKVRLTLIILFNSLGTILGLTYYIISVFG